jgi:hypothetical protein
MVRLQLLFHGISEDTYDEKQRQERPLRLPRNTPLRNPSTFDHEELLVIAWWLSHLA